MCFFKYEELSCCCSQWVLDQDRLMLSGSSNEAGMPQRPSSQQMMLRAPAGVQWSEYRIRGKLRVACDGNRFRPRLGRSRNSHTHGWRRRAKWPKYVHSLSVFLPLYGRRHTCDEQGRWSTDVVLRGRWKRGSGQHGARWQGWTRREWTTWHEVTGVENPGVD